jgi:hypothetical protein
MANKVLYIKIARIDQNGNDQTNSLEALTQITLPYVNGVSKRYIVTSITREQDYFFYSLSLDTTSSTYIDISSNNTLEYKFTSSISTNTISHYMGVLDASAYAFYNIPLTSPTNDPFGFYDENAQTYKFDTYSQKDLTLEIVSSLSVNNTILSSVRISVFINNPNNPLTANDVTSGNNRIATQVYGSNGTQNFNKTVTIPSESIAPGNEIKLIFSNGGGFAGTREVTFASGAEYKISSTPATGTNIETIPEPYLTSVFYGGDCDVLINNAELYRENPFLQDLDYSTNPNVPINFNLVLNGTAARATVPESNYTFNNILNPNYSSVNSTTKYNSDASSFNSQISAGVFVAYYKSSVTSGTPGSGYTTNFVLSYLITPDEEALEINNTEEMLNLLGTNFSVDANPLPSSEYPFGLPTGEIRVKATPLSGSDSGSALEYRGTSLIKGINTNLPSPFNIVPPITILQVKTSGSESPGSNNPLGGIIYPASISLTSHADLPSKAREILTRNNIIAPSSTSS